MLIKRNVYFSAIDQETGEERLFSVNEILDEKSYLERLYSEKDKKDDKEKKLSLSDKLNLATVKVIPKKICKEQADYWGSDEEKSKKAGNKMAKREAITTGAIGAVGGGVMGHLVKGGKGAAAGAAIGTAIGAGSAYVGSKAGQAISRKLRKKSEGYRKMAEKGSDQWKVGAKEMTKEEYRKKYGK